MQEYPIQVGDDGASIIFKLQTKACKSQKITIYNLAKIQGSLMVNFVETKQIIEGDSILENIFLLTNF